MCLFDVSKGYYAPLVQEVHLAPKISRKGRAYRESCAGGGRVGDTNDIRGDTGPCRGGDVGDHVIYMERLRIDDRGDRRRQRDARGVSTR